MEEDERMNFNSFVDAYNAYQNPNLAPVAPAFGGYNYQAPQLNMVQAPNQLPPMSINPDAIYDPTVGAAMQILNRPMMMAQTPGLLGSGTDYQQQFGLLADIAPERMQQYQRMADPVSLIDSIGVGSGSDNYGNYDLYSSDPYGGYDQLSIEGQNASLVNAGWDPMGYDDSAPDMSDFGDYSYGSDGSVGGFF